jgi:hypothetical protein
MIDIVSEADVQCDAERIFDLIIDLRGQDRWLSQSAAFRGTADISSNPVALGTTFRESSPFGVRNGTVTEFERPAKITFHQPMTMKLHAGVIDITMRYRLVRAAGSTRVERRVTIAVPWPLRLFAPMFVRAFRTESRRTLLALKAYADNLSERRSVMPRD